MSRKQPWGRRSSDNQAYPKLPDKSVLPTGLTQVTPFREMEVIPVGECYLYLFNYAVKHPYATYMHGTVVEPFAVDPNRHLHAWVEEDDMIYDWQTMEAGEGGKFSGIGWDKAYFYEMFEPEVHNQYTAREIMQKTTGSGHCGPWEE